MKLYILQNLLFILFDGTSLSLSLDTIKVSFSTTSLNMNFTIHGRAISFLPIWSHVIGLLRFFGFEFAVVGFYYLKRENN